MQRLKQSRNNNTCSELKLAKREIWATFRHGGEAAVILWRSFTVSSRYQITTNLKALQILSSRFQEVTATLRYTFPQTSLSFTLVAGSTGTVGLTGLLTLQLLSWVDTAELPNNFPPELSLPQFFPQLERKKQWCSHGAGSSSNLRNVHNYLIHIS